MFPNMNLGKVKGVPREPFGDLTNIPRAGKSLNVVGLSIIVMSFAVETVTSILILYRLSG